MKTHHEKILVFKDARKGILHLDLETKQPEIAQFFKLMMSLNAHKRPKANEIKNMPLFSKFQSKDNLIEPLITIEQVKIQGKI